MSFDELSVIGNKLSIEERSTNWPIFLSTQNDISNPNLKNSKIICNCQLKIPLISNTINGKYLNFVRNFDDNLKELYK